MLFERALDSMLQRQSQLMLEQEWGDVLAYLNLNTDPPTWSPHAKMPGEREVVARIRQYIDIESLDGRVWEVSTGFRHLTDYTFIDHDEAMAAPRPLLSGCTDPAAKRTWSCWAAPAIRTKSSTWQSACPYEECLTCCRASSEVISSPCRQFCC